MRHFYVVGPVGADPQFSIKQSIITELAVQRDLTPFFPIDNPQAPSSRDTFRELQSADFVLVDLSLERPSCYFELGLARTTGTTIFLVATTGTPIHQVGGPEEAKITFYQDLKDYRQKLTAIFALTGPL
jgi:hypothetical protein